MEPLAFVPLLLLNLADAKNPSGTSGRVLCVCYETENRLFDDQQQAHLELALCSDAVQAVFVKTEALACGQLIVLTLIADDGFAFQRGQDALPGARCGVRPVPSSKAISTNFMLSAWTRSRFAMLPSS